MRICLVQAHAPLRRPGVDIGTDNTSLRVSWQTVPSLGIAYLHSYLENKGHKVFSVNLNLDFVKRKETPFTLPSVTEHVEFIKTLFPKIYHGDSSNIRLLDRLCDRWSAEILNLKPDIVGFSITLGSALVSLILARKIKKKNKKKIIVLGGPEGLPQLNAHFFIRTGWVDIVVMGEGEVTLSEVMDLLAKDGRVDYCKGTLINKKGEIIDCGPRELIKDLDVLPFPNFDLSFPRGVRLERIPITLSRGCTERCNFCPNKGMWKYYRHRSIKNIIQEIKYQKEKYGVSDFIWNDDLINADASHLSKLCDAILEERLNIRWVGNVRIHPGMTRRLLKKMYESGCRILRYGIESGSQHVLDSMKKRIRIEDAARIIKNTHEAKISTFTYWIIGFPTETEEDFIQTCNFISKNKKNIDGGVGTLFHLLPLAPIYKNLERFSIVLPDTKKNKMKYSNSINCLKYFNSEGFLERWQTKDGRNTPATRAFRQKVFYLFAKKGPRHYGF